MSLCVHAAEQIVRQSQAIGIKVQMYSHTVCTLQAISQDLPFW